MAEKEIPAGADLTKFPTIGTYIPKIKKETTENEHRVFLLTAYKDWIPCSERLPEDRDNVLTYDVDGNVRKCEYDAEFKKFRPEFTNYYAMEVSYVTHWMPLPEPPEKE